MRTIRYLAILVVLSGCGGNAVKEQQVTPKITNTEKPALASDMHRHFDDINAIQLALISGNLTQVRVLAQRIRVGFSGPVPSGWEPFIERSVVSAEMLSVVDDLGMAARVASLMAGTCGDCHRNQNVVVVKHEAISPPHESDRFSDFMIQHRWAADRMWEGLIGPSDAAWLAGTQVLSTTPLTAEDLGERLILNPAIEGLLVQIRKDGEAASRALDAKGRQELYGSFLAGCAGCHQQMMNQRD